MDSDSGSSSNSDSELDENIGDHILIRNATLIVVDSPGYMEFGIDLNSWDIKIKKEYIGVKFIPPGFHFVHYKLEDIHGGPSFRIGFIHYFENGEFMVKRWDKIKNELSPNPVSGKMEIHFRKRLLELDKSLVPYCFDYYNRWKKLTDKIGFDVIKRCQPLFGFIRSALEFVPSSKYSEHHSDGEEEEEEDDFMEVENNQKASEDELMQNRITRLLPTLKPRPGSELRLTPLPEKYHPDNASPQMITECNLDYSYAWETLVSQMKCPGEILGELQLTFVSILVGQSWEAFEKWKGIFKLLCGVDSALPKYKGLFLEFLWTLENQLDYIPEDILVDVMFTEQFIYYHLRKFLRNIECHRHLNNNFKYTVSLCRDRICKMLEWDFGNLQEDVGDEEPMLVD
ncbi:hypothetical protein M0802_007292 [Mischocyttarus mexicanus]|nr:hypothetical protein M0802_007292 [Mischocyttarus mexicanus]